MTEAFVRICVLFVFVGEVFNSGVFEVRIRSLDNRYGRTVSGKCCSGPEVKNDCAAPCRTFFTLCLLHYQKPIPHYPTCTFGEAITQIVGENNIGTLRGAEPPFTVQIPFSFYWPGNFGLIIDAWHDRHKNKSTSDARHIILRVTRARKLKPSRIWQDDQRITRTSELAFSYRVICDENYYGLGCDKWCKERDGTFGHYRCTPNGEKTCLPGWQGELCDKVQCSQSCLESNGFCDTPGNCRCRSGWKGPSCQDCVPDMKCFRGYCHKAWDCICNEGWSGVHCSIFNSYCEEYSPCFNGGTCAYDDVSNYTCTCKPGFSGPNCEKEFCYNGFCLNDGICEEVGSKRFCKCEERFSGNRCQNKQPTCGEISCRNNGTCIRMKKRWACVCPPGYEGNFCERERNECASNPCKNGGSCRDRVNGYHCVCAEGFAGTNCNLVFDPCLGFQCFNGGKCVRSGHFSVGCACRTNFTGYRCETPRNPCHRVRCANGGKCVVNPKEKPKCKCEKGYSGELCQFKASNPCASLPCRHGGTCKSYSDYHICICPHGIEGDNCERLKLSSDDPRKKVEVDLPTQNVQSHSNCGSSTHCFLHYLSGLISFFFFYLHFLLKSVV